MAPRLAPGSFHLPEANLEQDPLATASQALLTRSQYSEHAQAIFAVSQRPLPRPHTIDEMSALQLQRFVHIEAGYQNIAAM